AYYTEGADMTTPEAAAAVAVQVAPFSAQAMAEGAVEPAIKEIVKARTEEAIARGIFGSPLFRRRTLLGRRPPADDRRLAALRRLVRGGLQEQSSTKPAPALALADRPG